MKTLGYLCYAFGVADLLLYWVMGIDLTGVQWSPLVAFLVGSAVLGRADER